MLSKKTIDAFLNDARIAIDNALAQPQIQTYLTEYGYTPEKLQQGKALYEAALAAQQKQKREYGEQYSATAALNETWETAKESYIRHIKIARITFKNDPGAAAELALNGSRKRTLSAWLLEAKQFYQNILSNQGFLDAIAEYGITPAKLEAAKVEVEAVEAANLAQKKEIGEAQDATKARDAVIEELSTWLSDFVVIARIALEEKPQLIESLGILERS